MIKPLILPLTENMKKMIGICEDTDYFVTTNVDFESDKDPTSGKISSLKWTYEIIERRSYIEIAFRIPDQKITVTDIDDETFEIQLNNVAVEFEETQSLHFEPKLIEIWKGKMRAEF